MLAALPQSALPERSLKRHKSLSKISLRSFHRAHPNEPSAEVALYLSVRTFLAPLVQPPPVPTLPVIDTTILNGELSDCLRVSAKPKEAASLPGPSKKTLSSKREALKNATNLPLPPKSRPVKLMKPLVLRPADDARPFSPIVRRIRKPSDFKKSKLCIDSTQYFLDLAKTVTIESPPVSPTSHFDTLAKKGRRRRSFDKRPLYQKAILNYFETTRHGREIIQRGGPLGVKFLIETGVSEPMRVSSRSRRRSGSKKRSRSPENRCEPTAVQEAMVTIRRMLSRRRPALTE